MSTLGTGVVQKPVICWVCREEANEMDPENGTVSGPLIPVHPQNPENPEQDRHLVHAECALEALKNGGQFVCLCRSKYGEARLGTWDPEFLRVMRERPRDAAEDARGAGPAHVVVNRQAPPPRPPVRRFIEWYPPDDPEALCRCDVTLCVRSCVRKIFPVLACFFVAGVVTVIVLYSIGKKGV